MDEQNTNFDQIQNALSGAIYNGGQERTYYDKTLSKDEVFRLREIVSKETLNKDDVAVIQNILVSNEVKLTNLNGWEKYIIGKYFIWLCAYAKRFSKALTAKEFYKRIEKELSSRTLEAREEIEKEYSETYRLMVHVYCYLIRSPLSINGAMLRRLTTNSQEIEYKGSLGGGVVAPQPNQNWRS